MFLVQSRSLLTTFHPLSKITFAYLFFPPNLREMCTVKKQICLDLVTLCINKKKTDAGAFLGTVLFSSPQQQHHIQKNTVFIALSLLLGWEIKPSHYPQLEEHVFLFFFFLHEKQPFISGVEICIGCYMSRRSEFVFMIKVYSL